MTIDRLLMVIFLLIAFANISDVVADYHMQVATWHLAIEGITVVISIAAFVVLWKRVLARNRELQQVKEALTRHQQREKDGAENQEAKLKLDSAPDSYTAVQSWFKQWKLSPSEQEVAVLLIKGLSFNEIAEVRSTKEKTVRQQASSVYAKSGLSGRNNLSAWLIDTLLE
ncbi:helix-turn-helix transcriptional regulator [Idiomarina piscisalsi]|uniref:LuxR family transcriptional regulator n=1 Tax=Idiomarina piscisalsi TaxID=1096243 RepID=A0A432YX62_9GAMM|nr:LuxR C-terminal-related transcriptional regulator [Idiomarina piscisalsi]RUO67910.1 LuxR family transcriptional regulator [Idiomarina piscisalsi]